jgi:hypothetical protein
MRLDLMSSTFGRAADYEAENDSTDTNDKVILDLEDGEEFDPATAGSPSVEPMFGPRYWSRCIPQLLLDEWTQIGEPQLPPPDSMLSLPPKNPFVPQDLCLKSLPPDDSHHPLVHCSLKLCIMIGKKKVTRRHDVVAIVITIYFLTWRAVTDLVSSHCCQIRCNKEQDPSIVRRRR